MHQSLVDLVICFAVYIYVNFLRIVTHHDFYIIIKVTQVRIASKEVLLKVIDLAVGAELDLPTTFFDALGINTLLILYHRRNFRLKVLIFYFVFFG
jgi:hypothetical protein